MDKNRRHKERYRSDPEYKKAHLLKGRKQRQDRYNFCANVKIQFGCYECGEDHHACLEFHHPDPTEKRQNTGKSSRCPSIFHLGWKSILEELAKCEVMCMNCHHKYHAKEMPSIKIKAIKRGTSKMEQPVMVFPSVIQKELF